MCSFIILILVSEYFILSGVMKEPNNKGKTPKSNFAHLKTDGTCVPNSHLLGTFFFPQYFS